MQILPLNARPLAIDHIDLDPLWLAHSLSQPQQPISGHAHRSTNTRQFDLEPLRDLGLKVLDRTSLYLTEGLGLDLTGLSLELQNSWFVYHSRGSSAGPHQHRRSVISGCYYLACDQDSGHIQFHSPCAEFADLPRKTWLPQISPEWSILPEPGTLLIFPSGLSHSVTESHSPCLRICLAWNIWIRGQISCPDQLSDLRL